MRTSYIAEIPVTPPTPKMGSPSISVSLEWLVISGVCVTGAALFGALRLLLGREVAYLEKRFIALEQINKDLVEKIAGIDRSVAQIQSKVSDNYVLHDDWVRSAAATDAKLDSMHRRFDQFYLVIAEKLK